jgi:hypothetical protein
MGRGRAARGQAAPRSRHRARKPLGASKGRVGRRHLLAIAANDGKGGRSRPEARAAVPRRCAPRSGPVRAMRKFAGWLRARPAGWSTADRCRSTPRRPSRPRATCAASHAAPATAARHAARPRVGLEPRLRTRRPAIVDRHAMRRSCRAVVGAAAARPSPSRTSTGNGSSATPPGSRVTRWLRKRARARNAARGWRFIGCVAGLLTRSRPKGVKTQRRTRRVPMGPRKPVRTGPKPGFLHPR